MLRLFHNPAQEILEQEQMIEVFDVKRAELDGFQFQLIFGSSFLLIIYAEHDGML